MTKFRLCYTYHFVMFVVLLLQIMYLIRGGFATCLTVKIPTSQRQAFSFMSRGSEKLMEILDHMNAKEVRGALYFAGQGTQQQWAIKREMQSPRYTTRDEDLLRVK